MRDRHLSRSVSILALCLVWFAATAAMAESAQAKPTHVVVWPVVNMYAKPTTDVDVVSQAVLGRCVREIEKKGKWTKIETDDSYQGWALKSALRKLQSAEEPYAVRPGFFEVIALQANVYREPDVTEHEPLVVLPFGARLEQAAPPIGEPWVQVRLPDRRLGWIQLGDVQHDPRPLSIDEAIALARRFMGITYLWGGVSSFGLDCSGFAQLLVRARGIIMPRDAAPQAAWPKAQPVETAKLEPGDLLYFGESVDKITHTGMYIGGGEFIHSTPRNHPGVQIGRLDDPVWKKLHVCSGRVQ